MSPSMSTSSDVSSMMSPSLPRPTRHLRLPRRLGRDDVSPPMSPPSVVSFVKSYQSRVGIACRAGALACEDCRSGAASRPLRRLQEGFPAPRGLRARSVRRQPARASRPETSGRDVSLGTHDSRLDSHSSRDTRHMTPRNGWHIRETEGAKWRLPEGQVGGWEGEVDAAKKNLSKRDPRRGSGGGEREAEISLPHDSLPEGPGDLFLRSLS